MSLDIRHYLERLWKTSHHIDINFLEPRYWLQPLFLILAPLMLIGVSVATWAYQSLREETKRVNTELEYVRFLEEGRHHSGNKAAMIVAPERIKAINTAIDELNVPWPVIFQVLEEVRPKDMALLHLEPDGGRGRLHVVAEAKTSQELTDFVSAALKRKPFHLFIPSRQEMIISDGQPKIRLTFDLEWEQ
jgi:hypothetical protein